MSYLQRQLLHPVRDAGLELALGLSTFVAGMAKRVGSVFAAAPIVQGKWDGTGTPDAVSFVRGNLIGNQAGVWYDNFDLYQGSIVFWITPEWGSGDGISHEVIYGKAYNDIRLYKSSSGALSFSMGGQTVTIAAPNLVAGNTYCIVARWDGDNTLDGTNHLCLSLNNAHTFAGTSPPSVTAPNTYIYVGANVVPAAAADALIEGLTIYRRPLWDGAYGVDMGHGDEIALIHAAGVGVDPCLITKGSWDIPFCLPSDSTPGALVTGEGEAWSHPHSSSEPKHSWLADGGYFTEPYAAVFNGADTVGNCGSGVTLDNLPQGASGVTFGAWVRADGVGGSPTPRFLDKGNWYAYMTADGYVSVVVGHADTPAVSTIDADLIDGKLHYITIFFESIATGGDGKVYIAAGGKWASSYISQSVGVGAVDNDAANDFVIGNRNAGARTFDGLIGLVTIWNDDHFNHGTDFIPPRAPEGLPDATVVEQWDFDEGTGNTAAAHVTTPANDCALTNHVWEEQWDIEGTPVIPQSVEFFEQNDGINFGSGANIDNLPSADCTLEFYGRIPKDVTSNTDILTKTNTGRTVGWALYTMSGNLYCVIKHAGTSVSVNFGPVTGNVHHHFAVDWDQGTLTARALLDGVEVDTDTAAGAYSADAAEDCLVNARGAIGTGDSKCAIGWIRLSDNRRYTGTNFVPNARTNPPANDANAHLLVNMTDGAGATATDTSGNGFNGAITFGADTRWNNTPDMEVDEPGARVFGWGYNLGSDGANDGMTQIDTGLTPGDDYVLRVPISVGQSGRAQAAIRIYDEIGAAIISTLAGPKYYGVHDGGNAAADLGDSAARWWQGFVGWTCYNIEDGSNCVITVVDGDMHGMTTPLAGGGSNDWQNGEHYLLRPPNGDAYSKHPWTETFCIELPAGCTSVSWKVLNPAGEGVLGIHQYEVQESLVTNGSMEVGAGNPWIPTGYTDVDLDAGDSAAGATLHSGAASLQYNVGADGEGVRTGAIMPVAGQFYGTGGWGYTNGGHVMLGALSAGTTQRQAGEEFRAATGSPLVVTSGAAWNYAAGVVRAIIDAGLLYLRAYPGASGTRFVDDIYLFALDAVSLTVTPASEANSAESGGLRVDGRDKLTHPHQGKLKASNGSVTGKSFKPRHAAADAVKFGQTASYLLDIYENVNNYIRAYWSAANTITLAYNAQGAGEQTTTWNATGVWAAGTERKITLSWSGGGAYLKADAATVAHIAGAVTFATDFTTTIKWGTRQDGAMQFDGVVKEQSEI